MCSRWDRTSFSGSDRSWEISSADRGSARSNSLMAWREVVALSRGVGGCFVMGLF